MNLHNIGRLTMTVTEAGKLLGIGRTSVYAAIRKGELPSFKIGRRILVPTLALARKIEGLQQGPTL